jgi:hypothetical protein
VTVSIYLQFETAIKHTGFRQSAYATHDFEIAFSIVFFESIYSNLTCAIGAELSVSR